MGKKGQTLGAVDGVAAGARRVQAYPQDMLSIYKARTVPTIGHG